MDELRELEVALTKIQARKELLLGKKAELEMEEEEIEEDCAYSIPLLFFPPTIIPRTLRECR
jgi:hypothetical protein